MNWIPVDEEDSNRHVFELVGRMSLLFGSFERNVRHAIARLDAEAFPDSPMEAFDRQMIDLNHTQFNTLQTILKRRVSKYFDGDEADLWNDFIEGANEIASFRNSLVHNSTYISDGILHKEGRMPWSGGRGKDTIYRESDISVYIIELNERYRQLEGSIWMRRSTWISKYPMLPMPNPVFLCGLKAVDCYWDYEEMMAD